MLAKFEEIKKKLEGEFYTDKTQRVLYATDASVYREVPMAVCTPKSEADIKTLIAFANENKIPVVPRTAGTSLAGQVVGNGIIVDVSKHFTQILEVNKEEKWVRVQPGIIRDDLNKYLKPYGLFFAPETSTSNRCMIGGMVGNNSCGSHSPLYGTTRDHLLELKTILSDGSDAFFKALTKEEFFEKVKLPTLEGKIYQFVYDILSQKENQDEIRKEFPKPEINRRNTGYAIDVLLESEIFTEGKPKFNFCKLLTGSEGTLAFTTEIKINLVDLPPKEVAVVAIHSNTINESLKANRLAMKYKPGASELMDKVILDCTKNNIEQSKNRFFVEGDPAGVLCVEFERETKEEIEDLTSRMIAEIKEAGFGYHFPVIWGDETKKVWSLRVAGLGLLGNIPGDEKGVACIEDTSVTVEDLPEFIDEFDQIMARYGKSSIYYAHAGDGEIHLRPILDLKKEGDRQLFYEITNDVATLVKKYGGSMSGEHGDGRVRAPFVKKMIGEKNYALIEEVKKTWDPNNIFNPGKIVNPPKMNEFLRYENNQVTPEIDTILDFSDTFGIVRMAEQCNGTGVCRRTHLSGGTMCPSYMATKNEKDTTRGRANILREFLTRSEKTNRFDHEEIKEVMDLCLGCKGCKSDCPSNVDVAKMKSEFLQHYYDANGVPLSAQMIAKVGVSNKLFSMIPNLYNYVNNIGFVKSIVSKKMGFSPKRELPKLAPQTLSTWYKHNQHKFIKNGVNGKVYFFADEVINYNDVTIGQDAIKLLIVLGYEVEIVDIHDSGRPAISKGLLRYAKEIAAKNIKAVKNLVTENTPLIGIEPSAILSFRDEYISFFRGEEQAEAKKLSENCFLIEEFIFNEFKKGKIKPEQFSQAKKEIVYHGHCHQKTLSDQSLAKKILEIPANYKVEIIPSGCCGMSGSFGYEEKHYDTSMKIGELVLFPAVRKANETGKSVCASGTSCRHQIKDGTQTESKHPVQYLLEAVR